MALIGIDAHTLGRQTAGNERYTAGLLEGLAEIESPHEYLVYIPHDLPEEFLLPYSNNPALIFRKLNSKTSVFRLSLEYPRLLRRDQPALVHFQYVPPLLCKSPVVLSIHDVLFHRLPATFKKSEYWRFRLTQSYFARKSRVVLTLSEFSRTDICSVLDIPPDKVRVVYPAVQKIFVPRDKSACRENIARKYGIKKDFLLYVGSIQPRKNIELLFQVLRKLVIDYELDIDLVIAGKTAWLYDSVLEHGNRNPLRNRFHFPGYVPDNDLVDLYNSAEVFLYPPFLEGFGIPPVEAMACSLPVIVSNTSCFPEVVGNAGVQIAPDNPDAWADKTASILRDSSLRTILSENGLARSESFSPQRFAESIVNIYNTIIDTHETCHT